MLYLTYNLICHAGEEAADIGAEAGGAGAEVDAGEDLAKHTRMIGIIFCFYYRRRNGVNTKEESLVGRTDDELNL